MLLYLFYCTAAAAVLALPTQNVELVLIVENGVNADLSPHLSNLTQTLTTLGQEFDQTNFTLSVSLHQTSDLRHENCFTSIVSAPDSYLPVPWTQVVPKITSFTYSGIPSAETATTRVIPFLAYNGYSKDRLNTRRVMVALTTSNATWTPEENNSLHVGQTPICTGSSEPSAGQVFRSLKLQEIGLLVQKIGLSDPDEWTQQASHSNYKDFIELTMDPLVGPIVDQVAVDEPVVAEEAPIAQFESEMSAVETSLRKLITPNNLKQEMTSRLTMDHTKQCEVSYGNWEHILTVDLTSKRADRLMRMAGALGKYIESFVERIEALGGVSKAAVYFIREHQDSQEWCFTRARRIKESAMGLSEFFTTSSDKTYTPRGLGNAVIVEAMHWSMRTFTTLLNHPELPQFRFFSLFTYTTPSIGLEPYTYQGVSFPCEEEKPFSLDVAMRDFEQWRVRLMIYVADDGDDKSGLESTTSFWNSIVKSRLNPDQSVVIASIDDSEDVQQLQTAYRSLMCLDI